jgi:CxxC motif-containing protein (DUF1111 family)
MKNPLPTFLAITGLCLAQAAGAPPTPSIESGVELTWTTTLGNTYQAQWAPDVGGPWTDLGLPVLGDGSSQSIYDSEMAGTRHYQVVEVVPGSEPVAEIPFNGGFESGTESDPDNWSTAANQPPARSSDDAHTGSFSMHSVLANVGNATREGRLIQNIAAEGGSIEEGKSYDFSFWAKQVSAGASYVQQYELSWRNASGRVIGGTGLKNFSAEMGSWTQITKADLVAPAGAVDARVTFRFVTGAVLNDFGEVFIDDVSFATDSDSVTPGETNYIPLVGEAVSKVSWPTNPGVPYQPVSSRDFQTWADIDPVIQGDGGIGEILVPQVHESQFYRVEFPGPVDLDGDIIPLFDASTVLEPATTVDTPTALVTHVADRARDRHAREGNFTAYDHYLSWYWEERTIAIEIIDRVAKGGSDITFNYTTLTPLGAAEFRAFFRGIGTVAEYHSNQIAELVGPNQYSATIDEKFPVGSGELQIGDRIEIEISQFIQAPANGRNNYYGTTILYVVGQGIVPWQGVTLPGAGPALDSYPLPEIAWLGGQTTLPYQYSNEPDDRFKQTAGNIAPISAQPFMLGRRLHHTDFGSGVHSESGNPVFAEQSGKLGPHFIARSCVECHVNNGRALPPAIGQPMLQTVVKIGSDAQGSTHPVLGSVLQSQSTGAAVEAGVTIASYTNSSGQYGDGTAYSLRKPNYAFTGITPAFFSARLAPPLVGMGLIEAIDESEIIALADPDDADSDGISGRFQTVADPETGDVRLGRFTGKATQARLRHQIAGALNTDMGITTSVFPIPDGETTAETPELADADLDKLNRYVALLGVSARRDLSDPQALLGEQLFSSAQCIKCHAPQLNTGSFHPMTELRNQTIRPFSDFLLHDMGAGLADNMGAPGASGAEWRTPPLWGIGLTYGVSGGEAYLHDGRARSLEEAILWHGGEAEIAKENFRTMAATDREALVKFLKSL